MTSADLIQTPLPSAADIVSEAPAAQFIPTPFIPRRLLRNPHLQTIAGNFLRRTHALPPATAELVEVSPATAARAPARSSATAIGSLRDVRCTRPTAIVVHGLEGSSNSQYVAGNAKKLWRAGANVIRMNMRNCGGTIGGEYDMARSPPRSTTPAFRATFSAVMRHFIEREHLQSVSLIGYSMGGNLVLKLAGELGAGRSARAQVGHRRLPRRRTSVPPPPRCTCPQNRLYERRFLRALLRRYRRKTMLFPRAYDPNRATGISSLRDFDDRITALYSGFASAEDYYYRAAAARVSIASPSPRSSSTPWTTRSLTSRPPHARACALTRTSPSSRPHTAATAPSSPPRPGDGQTMVTGQSPRCCSSSSRTLKC